MRKRSIVSLMYSILGIIFCFSFQSMAYWGPNGTLAMQWYWGGASLAYLFAFISAIMIYPNFKVKKKNMLDFGLILFNSFLVWATIILTTIILILLQAEF